MSNRTEQFGKPTAYFSMVIDKEVIEGAKKIAKQNNVTLTGFIRDLLQKAIDETSVPPEDDSKDDIKEIKNKVSLLNDKVDSLILMMTKKLTE